MLRMEFEIDKKLKLTIQNVFQESDELELLRFSKSDRLLRQRQRRPGLNIGACLEFGFNAESVR